MNGVTLGVQPVVFLALTIAAHVGCGRTGFGESSSDFALETPGTPETVSSTGAGTGSGPPPVETPLPLPSGSACSNDEVCSERCIFGLCAPQSSLQGPCDNAGDCLEGSCVELSCAPAEEPVRSCSGVSDCPNPYFECVEACVLPGALTFELSFATSLASADLDGNGVDELLVFDSSPPPGSQQVHIFRDATTAASTVQNSQEIWSARFPRLVDIDGDGALDVITAWESVIFPHFNTLTGTLQQAVGYDTSQTITAFEVFDVDADGREEFITLWPDVMSQGDTLTTHFLPPGSVFATALATTTVQVGDRPHWFVKNPELGVVDLLYRDQSDLVRFRSDELGEFGFQSYIDNIGEDAFRMVHGVVTPDDADAVTLTAADPKNPDAVPAMFFREGVLGVPVAVSMNIPATRLHLADVIGDSSPDLIVFNDDEFEVLEHAGDGAFSSVGAFPGGGDLMTTLDFDGDGLTDIALFNSDSGTITLYFHPTLFAQSS